ncbi:hypothetical protein [Nocardiopsis sp. NPDC057823]|uniref:hypothetical protein n=1 Tax=Nocardiopsis sp. NPDC057823 TaxID=3346256 RepID=UPI00366F84D7
MTAHPTARVLLTEDGPMALVRGATDAEVREHLDALLAETGYVLPDHEQEHVRAGWLRTNPCPPACGGHRGHYDPAAGPAPGAFQGALLGLASPPHGGAGGGR